MIHYYAPVSSFYQSIIAGDVKIVVFDGSGIDNDVHINVGDGRFLGVVAACA
jgi:hypothetical protein